MGKLSGVPRQGMSQSGKCALSSGIFWLHHKPLTPVCLIRIIAFVIPR